MTTTALDRRRERILALTREEAISALLFLSGFTPTGTDQALASTWPPDPEPVLCAACGDSGTELDEVVSVSLADGATHRRWYCHDITACSVRRHPELAALGARDAEAAKAGAR